MTAGRDRTVIFLKVEEESHLIYRAGGVAGSANVVACLDDDHFVTGNDTGSLRWWTVDKRRPISTVMRDHGDVFGSCNCRKHGCVIGI